jgi:hypothetical protein
VRGRSGIDIQSEPFVTICSKCSKETLPFIDAVSLIKNQMPLLQKPIVKDRFSELIRPAREAQAPTGFHQSRLVILPGAIRFVKQENRKSSEILFPTDSEGSNLLPTRATGEPLAQQLLQKSGQAFAKTLSKKHRMGVREKGIRRAVCQRWGTIYPGFGDLSKG